MTALVPPIALDGPLAALSSAIRGRRDGNAANGRIARRGGERATAEVTAIRAAGAGGAREHDLTEQTDEQLLVASLGGDRAAFASLLERYRQELLHFLIRFLGSRAAAEDVFQDTFLQVHLSARTFDPERRFKPWLFTIAANKARDHHRRNRRRQPLSLSATASRDGEGESFVDLMAGESPLPHAALDDEELAEQVRQVMDALPAHHREILLLSYFQRMSYNQIAESLEIPLGTVKSRLHAAVARFADAWRVSGQGRTESNP